MPNYSGPSEIYDEMASLAPKFSGISYARLEESDFGLQWPCTAPDHPGTEILHSDGPAVGKAALQSVAYRPSDELPDTEFPAALSTGRTLYHYNAGTRTRRESGPVAKQSGNFVEMHRRDARKLGVEHAELVEVVSRRGAIQAEVTVSPRMRRGCVWMPMHFADSRVNLLTNDTGDQVTGTGECKVCAVRIAALTQLPGFEYRTSSKE